MHFPPRIVPKPAFEPSLGGFFHVRETLPMADDPAQPVICRECGSDNVAAAWTGTGELRMAVCRGCGWRLTRSTEAPDIHPLAQLVAELDPHFGAAGMI